MLLKCHTRLVGMLGQLGRLVPPELKVDSHRRKHLGLGQHAPMGVHQADVCQAAPAGWNQRDVVIRELVRHRWNPVVGENLAVTAAFGGKQGFDRRVRPIEPSNVNPSGFDDALLEKVANHMMTRRQRRPYVLDVESVVDPVDWGLGLLAQICDGPDLDVQLAICCPWQVAQDP